MLTRSSVPAYVARRGLIGVDSIVDGDLVVRDASGRNQGFVVERARAPSYFLKQYLGSDASATMAYESSLYEAVAGAGGELAGRIPAVIDRDVQERVLILELVPGAEDLRDRHLRLRRFPPELGAEVGRLLASLHRAETVERAALRTDPPRTLSLHRPRLSELGDLSLASLELVSILQRAHEITDRLDRLAATWRPLAPVHQDAKWDNLLHSSRPADGASLRLVDWEHAGLGDPCWDLGTALSQYLVCWATSVPAGAEVPNGAALELARYPLEAMRPAIRALWASYVDAGGTPADGLGASLLRSVEMAGARLIHSAFELTQARTELSATVVLLVQLAANVLGRPRDAAADLLGLPPVTAPAS